MPERARAVFVARDENGTIMQNATITLKQPGTNTNIADTIYVNDDPDASTYTNGAFFTAATGLGKFYLTNEQRVDALVELAGHTSMTIPIDVQKSTRVGVTTIQEEGVALTERSIINLIGSAVTAADDAANGRTNVTITASGENVATSTIWDAAGDLAKGTGADTAARLARGTASQVLRVNSGGTDIEWGAAPAPSFVGARAYASAATSLVDSAWTVVALAGESFDSGSLHDTVTNNSRITVPSAGKYQVNAQGRTVSNDSDYIGIRILKNGVEVASHWHGRSIDLITSPSVNVADIVSCAANDYIEMAMFQRSGAAINSETGEATVYLSVAKVGE